MGDDLIAAKRFCADADQRLAILRTDSLTSYDALSQIKQLKNSADDVNARAISRYAQSLINNLTSQKNTPHNMTAPLAGLSSLVKLYKQGVSDLTNLMATRSEETANVAKHNVNERPKDGFQNTHVTSETSFTVPSDDNERYNKARQTLKPLLKFAPTQSNYKALSQLAGFGLRQDAKNLYTYTRLENAPTIHADIGFDIIISSLTEAALKTARRHNKVVSLSYDVDEIKLSHTKAKSVEHFTIATLSALITHIIESPDIRQARGQSRSAHIALGLKQVGSDIKISFECPGTSIPKQAFANIDTKNTYGKVEFHSENDEQVLIMTFTQSPMPALHQGRLPSLSKTMPMSSPTLYEGAL